MAKNTKGTQTVTKKRKQRKNIVKGIAHIHASYNNTLVTITDEHGNVICWSSGGAIGYKGSKKATPYAAQLVAEAVAKKGMENGIKTIEVHVKGPGNGRDAAIRTLDSAGLKISAIIDVTSSPHNGCRPPKVRRV